MLRILKQSDLNIAYSQGNDILILMVNSGPTNRYKDFNQVLKPSQSDKLILVFIWQWKQLSV